ncbi:MAG: hypothetical protein ACOX9R_02040 [Armatimonadota bacterium]|jgi:hypothetical protein
MTPDRRVLEGLEWKPAWISHMGCHHGCIDYLGLGISRAWIFGGTGHAFAVNVHEELCPSGPTAWNTDQVDHLAANIGYLVEGVTGHVSQRDFEARQKIAWALVTGCIDSEVPCYGWDLVIPEWYVITGYDDEGYYFSGPGADEATMPLAADQISRTEIGWLAVKCVVPCHPAPDEEIVAAAVEFALEHAEGKHAHEGYVSGPAAFELWATALETGRANRFGAGYNGECWRECRQMAVEFLREARGRLAREEALFDDAVEHYSAVAGALDRVVERVPFRRHDEGAEEDTLQDGEAAAFVREAGAAEERALAALRKLNAVMHEAGAN